MDKTYTLQNLEFEWDEEKYALNLRKHGVTFEEAAEVFFDELNLSGDASVEDENRMFVLGFSGCAHFLYTVFVEGRNGKRLKNAACLSANTLT